MRRTARWRCARCDPFLQTLRCKGIIKLATMSDCLKGINALNRKPIVWSARRETHCQARPSRRCRGRALRVGGAATRRNSLESRSFCSVKRARRRTTRARCSAVMTPSHMCERPPRRPDQAAHPEVRPTRKMQIGVCLRHARRRVQGLSVC